MRILCEPAFIDSDVLKKQFIRPALSRGSKAALEQGIVTSSVAGFSKRALSEALLHATYLFLGCWSERKRRERETCAQALKSDLKA